MAIATVDRGDEVRSVDHNSIVGLLNGTANDSEVIYAQPVKLYQFNDPSTYSLTVGNQDTTAGLIAAFQFGTVGAATTVARITKAGIIGVMRDANGFTLSLEGQATGTINAATLTGSTTVSDAAWTAAFTAIAAVGGGTITLGPGSFLAPSTAVTNQPHNCIIRGAGIDATILIHPASTNQPPILFYQKTDCGATEMTINGNQANNTTYSNSEASIDGTNNFCYRVKFTNYNAYAITCNGADNVALNNRIEGIAPASYTQNGDGPNFQSLYGIVVPSTAAAKRIKIIGNVITGTRSAAILASGIGCLILNNQVEDCHRGDFPLNVPGGCIALQPTFTSVANDTASAHCVIAGNYIGPSPTTATGGGTGGAGGIEIDTAQHILIADNVINDVKHSGIKIAASLASPTIHTYDIVISGGSIHSVNTVNDTIANGGGVAIALIAGPNNISGVTISDVAISSCANVLYTVAATGALTAISLHGLILDSNTYGWTDSTGITTYHSYGHTYVATSHAPLAVQMFANYSGAASSSLSTWAMTFYNAAVGSSGSLTGNGVQIRAGDVATDFSLRVINRAASLDLFNVLGTGICNIGDNGNGDITKGLNINQGAADDHILTLKSSDVDHQMSGIAEIDTYAYFAKIGPTAGGVNIVGLTEATIGVNIAGFATAADGTYSTAGVAAVTINGSLKSGAVVGSLGADKSILAVRDNGTSRFFLDSDGDSHQDIGTAWTNFDREDDIELLNTIAFEAARPGNQILDEFGRFVTYNRTDLERLGIVHFNEDADGRPFANMSRLTMLLTGAVRRLGLEVNELRSQMRALPSGGA